MANPFDSAWALLKASTVQTQLNTPSLDNTPETASAQRMWYKNWPKNRDSNNPIRVPKQPQHLLNLLAGGVINTDALEDPIADEMRAEQRHRKELDKKERFRQQMNQYIPRLTKRPMSNQEDRYQVKVGPSLAGKIFISPPIDDPNFNFGSISSSEIAPHAQRLGLYGRALQSIIDDTGKLRSYNRNINSQPFHQQFKPVNAIKTIEPIEPNEGHITNDFLDIHEYTAKPPKETPREFGDLQYDTGALPLYPNIDSIDPTIYTRPTPTQQQTLDQYTHIPVPGGVSYTR